MASKWEDEFDL
jgi:hypothetical protein